MKVFVLLKSIFFFAFFSNLWIILIDFIFHLENIMIDINTFLWVQKVYAQGTPPPIDWSLEGYEPGNGGTNWGNSTENNEWIEECSFQYWSAFNSSSSESNNSCSCNWPDNTAMLCTQLSQDYLDQQLCSSAPKHSTWDIATGQCICAAWLTDTWADGTRECINNAYGNLGIQCSAAQMRNGTCSWNINKTFKIKESNTTSNPTLFVQDIVLAATSFIGTLMVIALLVMGFKYVMGGMDESSTGNLKGNIKKLLIWLGLVIGSYTIIRLIQYIARGY